MHLTQIYDITQSTIHDAGGKWETDQTTIKFVPSTRIMFPMQLS